MLNGKWAGIVLEWDGLRSDFSEGLNAATLGAGPKTKTVRFLSYRGKRTVWKAGFNVYLNKQGELAFEYTFESHFDFHEGLAKDEDESARSSFLGLFGIHKEQGLYGFTGRDGRYVIPAQYENAEHFSEGFASARTDKGWAYINKKREMVIQPHFVETLPFSEGIATAKHSNGNWVLLVNEAATE